ncbi:regulatory protein RecX [Micropruina sp.]|uniref:regulatory protein RecX n=1 Tax=Micropruina sp. TaxID=2737536 RepID=UPI0039E359E8
MAGSADGPDADPVTVAREIALRLLSVRDRTRHELQQALAKKQVPPAAVTEVLDRLTEVGLINDQRFAEVWFETQQRRQRSSRVLRQELRTKGVDVQIVEQAAASVDSDADLEAATALVAKRVRALQRLPYDVRYRRLAGQLARRGFSPGVISTVLGDLPRQFDDQTDAFGA